MELEDQILLNKCGQGLVMADIIRTKFSVLEDEQKKIYLTDLIHLLVQSKPVDSDRQTAIVESGLKPTYTPCVMLRKGVGMHHLMRMTELPKGELNKVLMLLLSLFRIAYTRRFTAERNDPNKWWYWDLSDQSQVDKILEHYP